uniref:Uncharacterized protein n=1 Tax=Panagrolaimus sp. ES5 TaxID=591445 RepID=A0AC34G240_9BILA
MKHSTKNFLFILSVLLLLHHSTVSAQTCEEIFGPLAHGYFKCHTTYYPYFECIPPQWVCDEIINCQDGTDETWATCYGNGKK